MMILPANLVLTSSVVAETIVYHGTCYVRLCSLLDNNCSAYFIYFYWLSVVLECANHFSKQGGDDKIVKVPLQRSH